MTIELTVMAGLGIITFILSYYAFQFRESAEPFWQRISIGFFFMSLIFLNLLMNAILLIVQNNASVNYLTDSIIVWGLWIITWITIILLVLWLGFMLYLAVVYMFDKLAGVNKKRAEYK